MHVSVESTATFNTPFAALGQTPEGCSSFMFPHIMGAEVAKKLLEEGAVLNSHEALACGLVQCVLPADRIQDVVMKYCQHISDLQPDAFELIKRIKKENLLEKLLEVNLKECETLQKSVVSKKCFRAIAKYLDSRNMKTAAYVMK
jgi:Delta3-Delta2-enoyl-CoA isomerase